MTPRRPNCRDAELNMTDEQKERYGKIQYLLARYYEGELTGGGRWWHDYPFESELLGALGALCDEINGVIAEPPKPAPLAKNDPVKPSMPGRHPS